MLFPHLFQTSTEVRQQEMARGMFSVSAALLFLSCPDNYLQWKIGHYLELVLSCHLPVDVNISSKNEIPLISLRMKKLGIMGIKEFCDTHDTQNYIFSFCKLWSDINNSPREHPSVDCWHMHIFQFREKHVPSVRRLLKHVHASSAVPILRQQQPMRISISD
jgi:hypothetical protein